MNSQYINRELSLLQFHKRVLAEAQDRNVPLLERLRFLCISCTNLDEFFEIRVAGLKQRMEIGAPAQGPEKIPADEIFSELRVGVAEMVEQQYRLLNVELFPQLADAGVRFVHSDDWSAEQHEWLEEYFADQVVPVLTPLTFDPSRPFPRILNKSLNFIVRLHGKDAFGTGYLVRSANEPFLIGTRGKPETSRSVRSVVSSGIVDDIDALANIGFTIEAVTREHSRKPDEAFLAAEKLMPCANRLELFSRQERENWSVWGNQTEKFGAGG